MYSAHSANARRSYSTAKSREKLEKVVNAPEDAGGQEQTHLSRGAPDQSHQLDQHPHGERADNVDDQGGVGKAAAEQVPDRNVDQITSDRARYAAGGHRQQCGHRHEPRVLRPDFGLVLAQVRRMRSDFPVGRASVADHPGPATDAMPMLVAVAVLPRMIVPLPAPAHDLRLVGTLLVALMGDGPASTRGSKQRNTSPRPSIYQETMCRNARTRAWRQPSFFGWRA